MSRTSGVACALLVVRDNVDVAGSTIVEAVVEVELNDDAVSVVRVECCVGVSECDGDERLKVRRLAEIDVIAW